MALNVTAVSTVRICNVMYVLCNLTHASYGYLFEVPLFGTFETFSYRSSGRGINNSLFVKSSKK